MQGYVYTKDNNRTKEAVVVDKNSYSIIKFLVAIWLLVVVPLVKE